MRLAVAAALATLGLIAPGDRATATFSGGTLTLTLHYLMTCGEPGPGPLSVTLPVGFRIGALRATLGGTPAPVSHSGRSVQVTLPKPPQVTCMSIAEGTLAVRLANVAASAGSYTVGAGIRNHAFAARLRIQ